MLESNEVAVFDHGGLHFQVPLLMEETEEQAQYRLQETFERYGGAKLVKTAEGKLSVDWDEVHHGTKGIIFKRDHHVFILRCLGVFAGIPDGNWAVFDFWYDQILNPQTSHHGEHLFFSSEEYATGFAEAICRHTQRTACRVIKVASAKVIGELK
jgi:hypothetical protein